MFSAYEQRTIALVVSPDAVTCDVSTPTGVVCPAAMVNVGRTEAVSTPDTVALPLTDSVGANTVSVAVIELLNVIVLLCGTVAIWEPTINLVVASTTGANKVSVALTELPKVMILSCVAVMD